MSAVARTTQRRATLVTLGGVSLFAGMRALAGAPPSRASMFVVIGSIAIGFVDEWLFRGLLYGRLERLGPANAIAGAAIAFSVAHIPAHGFGSIPVNLCAGLVFGWQRWRTGGWGSPAVTHVIADLLALL